MGWELTEGVNPKFLQKLCLLWQCGCLPLIPIPSESKWGCPTWQKQESWNKRHRGADRIEKGWWCWWGWQSSSPLHIPAVPWDAWMNFQSCGSEHGCPEMLGGIGSRSDTTEISISVYWLRLAVQCLTSIWERTVKACTSRLSALTATGQRCTCRPTQCFWWIPAIL